MAECLAVPKIDEYLIQVFKAANTPQLMEV